MSKKGTRALASATLMSLVLTTALAAGPVKAAQGSVTRIGAADRYATAAQVATQNWKDGAKDVVLVSGEGYADAVSASALAKQLDAPILLTTAGSLNADAKAALTALKPTNVYVVGGNASVSASVRSDLKANYTLVELQGANRYETNVAVAKKLVDLGVKADNVLLVGGEGFSDALSVAPVAAAKGQILLLGNNNADSMKSVIDFVKANSSKVTVVGTSNVISDAIYNAVGAVDRVNGGASRFDTNINVLNKFAADLKADKLFIANASGNGYADALVASALAGKSAAPLVLVDAEGTSATTAALNYIKAKATKTTDLNVVGGTGVVSEATVKAINEIFNPTTPGTNTGDATVASVTATNLNQIKVVFNSDVDEDSAELVSNYKVDGTALSTSNAAATLADDNRTLTINLQDVKQQNKSYDVEVKDGVLTSDKTETVAKYGTTVTFSDVTAPTVSSVSVKGNSKLTVNFSEPIRMTGSYNATTGDFEADSSFTTKFKVNGQNISGFGLSKAVAKHEISTTTTTTGSITVWADGVDFYFSSKLPSGSNTLKVSDGTTTGNAVLSDAANFIIAENTQNFNVDSVTTNPVVKEVKADADGTMWVRFDRPMDKTTATKVGNYGLNTSGSNTGNMPANDGELKEDDCTVKFKGVSFATGANTLYISNSIKDAYGNKVADDTKVSFDNAKDEVKPTVTKVTMIDSSTIRITFSKDIDKNYATKISNYTLKDNTGSDLESSIAYIRPANSSYTDDLPATVALMSNDNVWDIKMKSGDSNKLTGSKYTLTIKNLVDTTSNINRMDDYTVTLTGNDDVAPKIAAVSSSDSRPAVISKVDTDHHKVVVFFTEEMDTDTLNNIDNYKYQNGSGDTNSLPSATKITASNDGKSVTLEFPSNYYVPYAGTNSAGVAYTGIDGDNQVAEILLSGVKDISGNVIDSFANSGTVLSVSSSSTAAYKSDTYRIEADGDDLLVKFQLDKSIDTDSLDRSQFKVAGENPDSVYVDGSNIVLRYSKDIPGTTTTGTAFTLGFADYINNPAYAAKKASSTNTNLTKIEAIKAQGSAADLEIVTGTKALQDIAGATIAPRTLATVAYDYLAAPKTNSDYWYAKTSYVDGTTTGSAVVLTFDNAIDPHSGVKTDDFTFTIGGESVKADLVQIKDNALVFVFTGTKATKFTASTSTATYNVGVALKNTSIDVEALVDDNENYAKYVPSTDDSTKTRQVKIY
ncbi:cell wall-binding repeat-containing protein [Clostridium magnum]|uniref:N-acetylmuramoyl-L-alanine amidase LytC n=1 Tax=Clostridium magnum DSM 2767 TaxID=1121326 RepID=A0A161WEU0_9CLOT|nr:cell wall-binding repeat-containing protein [Clostridium magnum]KZL90185.1 N-acetylmuramoyl-L-alanine amidase LytC precursor [Clostridium magnum DSM 2767]SHH63701.1 Putative cell wall binding repeat 2 [Clostridium magnum DSM 2767]